MKKATGSRYLLKIQLKKVLQESIERIESPDEADYFEGQIFRLRKAGTFDDATCQEMLDAIATVRKDLEVHQDV